MVFDPTGKDIADAVAAINTKASCPPCVPATAPTIAEATADVSTKFDCPVCDLTTECTHCTGSDGTMPARYLLSMQDWDWRDDHYIGNDNGNTDGRMYNNQNSQDFLGAPHRWAVTLALGDYITSYYNSLMILKRVDGPRDAGVCARTDYHVVPFNAWLCINGVGGSTNCFAVWTILTTTLTREANQMILEVHTTFIYDLIVTAADSVTVLPQELEFTDYRALTTDWTGATSDHREIINRWEIAELTNNCYLTPVTFDNSDVDEGSTFPADDIEDKFATSWSHPNIVDGTITANESLPTPTDDGKTIISASLVIGTALLDVIDKFGCLTCLITGSAEGRAENSTAVSGFIQAANHNGNDTASSSFSSGSGLTGTLSFDSTPEDVPPDGSTSISLISPKCSFYFELESVSGLNITLEIWMSIESAAFTLLHTETQNGAGTNDRNTVPLFVDMTSHWTNIDEYKDTSFEMRVTYSSTTSGGQVRLMRSKLLTDWSARK